MSARKRGATGLSGILVVDKPAGMTSHDVVARVRRATGEGRIGHAGTLDPAATGVLVVLLGPAARLCDLLHAATKRYLATVLFGASTDTDDAEGAVVETAPVPAAVHDPDAARAALRALVGESMQTPPLFSAIKVGGLTAHRVARGGGELELAARPITVHSAELIDIHAQDDSWDIDVKVSKGTYVRAIARDLGVALGTRAHLSALRRTESGTLGLADAHTLDDALAAAEEGRITDLFADPFAALGLPVVTGEARAVETGSALSLPQGLDTIAEDSPVAVSHERALVAIYRRTDDLLRPLAVLPGGVRGRAS